MLKSLKSHQFRVRERERDLTFNFPLNYFLFLTFILHRFVRLLMFKTMSTVRVRTLNSTLEPTLEHFLKYTSVRLFNTKTITPSPSTYRKSYDREICPFCKSGSVAYDREIDVYVCYNCGKTYQFKIHRTRKGKGQYEYPELT